MWEALIIIASLGLLEWLLDARRTRHDREWRASEMAQLKLQTDILEDIAVSLSLEEHQNVPPGSSEPPEASL